MWVVLVVNILAVFLAYLAHRLRSDNWLKAAFFIIFLFLALRFDYGNDYRSYLNYFIAANTFINETFFEAGWHRLCRIFSPFGFFAMVGVLAALHSYVYYNFIKRYVFSNNYWLAVFIYLFSPGLMLTQSSAMRQSISISLFLLSVDFLFRRKFIGYFLLISLATTFHQSSFLLFPVFLLAIMPLKKTNLVTVIFSSLFFVLSVLKSSLGVSIANLLLAYFPKFSYYENNQGVVLGTGVGYIFLTSLFFLILYYERFQVGLNSLFFRLSLLGFIVSQFAFINSSFARASLYFEPFLILVIPRLISSVSNHYFKLALLASYIVFILYGFFNFFSSEVWRDAFSVYRTIFSSPQLY